MFLYFFFFVLFFPSHAVSEIFSLFDTFSYLKHFNNAFSVELLIPQFKDSNMIRPLKRVKPCCAGLVLGWVTKYNRNRDKLRPGGPHWPVCRLYLYLSFRPRDRANYKESAACPKTKASNCSYFHIPLMFLSSTFPAMQYQRFFFSLFDTFSHLRHFKNAFSVELLIPQGQQYDSSAQKS